MNFNPQNEQGLLGLVAALKAGMDPGTAYSMYQSIAQDQAASIAARQQRLGGLAELLQGAAAQGMPYSGAEALMQAQPGPAGPAVQNILDTLYPGGQPGPGDVAGAMAERGSIDTQGGRGGGYTPPTAPAQFGPTATSPVYQPDPMAALQQEQAQMTLATQGQALQAAQQEATVQQLWTHLADDAQKYMRAGKSMQEFIQLASSVPQYQMLFGTEPDQVQKVLQTIFAGAATGA
jgi:hypothetical protein